MFVKRKMIFMCADLCSNKSSLYRKTGNAYWNGYKSAKVHFMPLLFCLGNWKMHLNGSNTKKREQSLHNALKCRKVVVLHYQALVPEPQKTGKQLNLSSL